MAEPLELAADLRGELARRDEHEAGRALRRGAADARRRAGCRRRGSCPSRSGARPQRSRPAKPSGRVRVWMANGRVDARAARVPTRSAGTPRSAKPRALDAGLGRRAFGCGDGHGSKDSGDRWDGCHEGVYENPETMTRNDGGRPDVMGVPADRSRGENEQCPCDRDSPRDVAQQRTRGSSTIVCLTSLTPHRYPRISSPLGRTNPAALLRSSVVYPTHEAWCRCSRNAPPTRRTGARSEVPDEASRRSRHLRQPVASALSSRP